MFISNIQFRPRQATGAFNRPIRWWTVGVLLATLFGAPVLPAGDTPDGDPGAPADTAAAPDGQPATLWFPVGESFRYRLQWGVINVGEAWMHTEWIEEDGRRLLAIRGGARTGRLVEKIYPIENRVEAVVDPVTFLPVRYRQRVREGRRRRDETTVFKHAEGVAEYTSHRSGKTKTIEIDADTRDLLTFFYAVRRNGMKPGEEAAFRVLVDDDVFDLTLTAQAYETVVLPGIGRIRSLRIEPKAKFGEVFVRRGRVLAWLSEDSRRVCVRISASLPVANVHAMLIAVEGPGDDRWSDGDEP